MKNSKKKKGFTLVEVLVVVLIVGILAAIAIPSYHFTVERSRATQGITSLTQIAKAQKTYNAKRGKYAESMIGLPLDMKDSDGSEATGAEFADQYFDYKIFGDEFERARATRNTGEYELSVDYGTGQIFCRPIEHKICQDLNLAEGEEFISWPQTEECKASIYGYNSYRYSCVRTLYKDGTKSDRVCVIDTTNGIACNIYDNDGRQRRQILTYPKNGTFRIIEYGDVYKEDFSYNPDGSLARYNKYLVEGNKRLEYYDGVTYDQYAYNGNITDKWTTYLKGTIRTHHYVDGKEVSRQYYNAEGKVYEINYRSDGKTIETIRYDSNGNITMHTCSSGACTEPGYVPATQESLGTLPSGLQIPNYCENDPEELELCNGGNN